jgi:3-oxoadipate enol-lactonase
MTALGLALEHRARIASICAANCTAQTPDGGAAMWDERIGLVRGAGMAAVVEATLARWFTAGMLATREDEVAPVRDMIRGTPVQGYVGCCAALKALAYRERLDSLRVPALFIAGAHDPSVPLAAMRDMHGRVTGSRYVELDAAHLSNLECAATFNAALLEFLRAQP